MRHSGDTKKLHQTVIKGFWPGTWKLRKSLRSAGEKKLMCTCFKFRSRTYNLYQDVPEASRGRRAANINRSLPVRLSQTSIGPSSFSRVLCSIHTPPPSASGMQKSANAALRTVTDENITDMRHRCQDLRLLKSLRGKNPRAVNVQSDGCYNNALYSGDGKTPFQPSTQAIYLVAENETPKHQIINLQTKTKKAWVGCKMPAHR